MGPIAYLQHSLYEEFHDVDIYSLFRIFIVVHLLFHILEKHQDQDDANGQEQPHMVDKALIHALELDQDSPL